MADNSKQVESTYDSEGDFAQIVADHMQDVALIVNQDQQIVYANQRLGDVLPDPSAVIGTNAVHAIDAITDDSAVTEDYQTAIQAVLQDGEERSVTAPVSLPDGNLVLDLRFTPYRDDGTVAGAVIIAREITEREQLKDQLLYLNQLLRHDVRSDLSVINGYAELLAEDLTEHQDEVEAIISASRHGFELTKTAQEFIQIVTQDGSALDQTSIQITRLIQSEVEQVRFSYPDAQITVMGELPRVHVRGNELLGSVVRNLLINAVQHNSEKDPSVFVRLEEGADTVELRVADNGPGIADGRKPEVFDQNEKRPESSGAGLGLYLVEQVVNECGGEVWLTDNEPTGAIFHVELPKAS